MKNILRRAMPPRLLATARRLRPFGNHPFDAAVPRSSGGLSDFFLYRGGDYESWFVAENTGAILKAERRECTHVIHYVDKNGRVFHVQSETTDRFNLTFRLDPGRDVATAGFIHQVFEKEPPERGLMRQHRGYTGYRLAERDDLPRAMVHGNFGGLFVDPQGEVRTHAIQRGRFDYSSQIAYAPGLQYELFFLNPTARPLAIQVCAMREKEVTVLERVNITPFGHAVISHESDGSQLFWRSRLPICRPIVFEHAPEAGFDVFHG